MALSNFGYHLFVEPFENSDTIPASLSHEVSGILSVDLGGITKNVQAYHTLDGNGFETVVSLGQAVDDGVISCLRTGEGDIYLNEEIEGSAFSYFSKWIDESTEQGGANSERWLVEVVPRGTGYEAKAYAVIPQNFKPGTKSADGGQTFSLTVKPFGRPVPVKVTESEGKFTIEKITNSEA